MVEIETVTNVPLTPDVALAAFDDALRALSLPDQAFLRSYLVSGSKEAACETAHLSSWDAERILAAPTTRRICELHAVIQDPQMTDLRHRLVLSLINDAFGDPAEAFDKKTGAVHPIHTIPPACRQRIVGYKNTRYGVEISFTNRLKAKEILAQLLGMAHGAVSPGLSITINTSQPPQPYTTSAPVVQTARGDEKSPGRPFTLQVGPPEEPA